MMAGNMGGNGRNTRTTMSHSSFKRLRLNKAMKKVQHFLGRGDGISGISGHWGVVDTWTRLRANIRGTGVTGRGCKREKYLRIMWGREIMVECSVHLKHQAFTGKQRRYFGYFRGQGERKREGKENE